MRFSVAIRTITLFEGGRAVFNVGGGIVFDSTAEAEYEECLLKARFAVGDQWIAR
jgi:para-aminobenzoate synthetase component 1